VSPAVQCTSWYCTHRWWCSGALRSSHILVCCCACSRCAPIHSNARNCCLGLHAWMIRLGSPLWLPRCLVWPVSWRLRFASLQRWLMMQRSPTSLSCPYCCEGWPTIAHGQGSPRHICNMNLELNHLQSLCVFAHVPHEWYCIDVQPFPGFIFFNVDNSLVDHTCCVIDSVMVRQCHRRRCVLVGDCPDCRPPVHFHIHIPDVCQFLLVEMRSVDCWHNLWVHLIGQRYTLVSP